MPRRKGELSAAEIDRRWRYQVAVPERLTIGNRFSEVLAFKSSRDCSPLGHTFVRDDKYHNVHCFAHSADAEAFQSQFGG